MHNTNKSTLVVILVCLVVRLDSVKVPQSSASLCPTNKIAPHRRAASWEEQGEPRTLGLIYSLLIPKKRKRPQQEDLDDLQEQPQEDDPDDCGEIEDYDETDLSSITPGSHNYIYNREQRENRLFFGDNYVAPPYYYYPPPNRPVRPPQRPPTTPRPHRPSYRPTKPPYHSGGVFGSNIYRPPDQHYPSDYIKPVHENTFENPQAIYRPGLVGGTLGQIIGFPPVRPTFSAQDVASQKKPNNPIRFPESDNSLYNKRHTRAKPNVATSIIGSFVDLLFH